MKNSEMKEGRFRGIEAFNFYDLETNGIASFRKDNGKFISFWKMNGSQIDAFLKNNNLI